MSLFGNLIKHRRDTSPTGRIVDAVKNELLNHSSEMRSVSEVIGLESLNTHQEETLMTAVENWQNSLESLARNLNIGTGTLAPSALDAGTAIMVGSTNINTFLSTPVTVAGTSTPTSTFVGMEGLDDAMSTRVPAFEAYDEKDNRNAVAYSVTYNMLAGRQNDFGEAFFPTVTVTNDNVGVEVSIRLIQVQNDFVREGKGQLANYQKKNIVKAMIDGTIMKNEMTRMFPVVRTGQNDTIFADPAIIAPYQIVNEGETILTAPLKFGVRLDLLGETATDALIANGLPDVTDSIDPAVELAAFYIKAGDDVIRLDVGGIAGNNFVASPQDLHRLQRMNFVTEGIMLNKDTTRLDGSALTTLGALATNDVVVYLRVGMFGEINVEQGDTQVHALEVKVARAYNTTTGLEIPLTDPLVTPIVTAVATATFEGYDLRAYRTNLNRRQRGQLLDVTYYKQIWAVPLRSPITMLRPVTADAQSDNADLAALVSATFVRTSNEAVRTLIRAGDMLKQHIDNRVARPQSEYVVTPALFGVARFLLDPTYLYEQLDVAAQINSIKSHDKAKDTGAVLVNKIRDMAYRLYRDSGFQAMVDTQAAGIEGNPTVIVGTDPMTARYLIIDGENRMAGPDFDYKVVTTPDALIQDKIFVVLGYPDKANGQLNPVHFGNMLWSPEMVLNLPISRNGQISKELTVQPRFRHIINVPVMARLDVKNLPQAATNSTVVPTRVIP